MSDYTPTTEEVRIRYSMDERFGDEELEAEWAAEFDRWLAAHDAEVYQRGREDEQNEHRVQGEGQVPFAACGDGEQTVVVSPVVEKLSNFKPLWADTAYGRIYFVPTARGDGEQK